ncbi:MAG TPA: hypothetical protein VNF47_07470 [Streptosporangiaceae bacterium]|nr:hypothetical protein [Streptosporangiaceae bacterium]
MSNEDHKQAALARAASELGQTGEVHAPVLARLWDEAYERGRLDALDELQDRFCVCMK